MRNDDKSYDSYRRAEEELNRRLEERRRAAEDAAKWEKIRQSMRQGGCLDEFESKLQNLRRAEITSARRHGKSLREARLRADDMIARLQKSMTESDPICREDERAGSDPSAGQ